MVASRSGDCGVGVLVLSDCPRGRLGSATAHLVAAAAPLGPVTLLVADDVDGRAAAEAATLAGVAEVWRPAPTTGGRHAIEDLAAALQEPARGFSHVFAAASSFGFSLIPYLAACLESAPVTDVVAIRDPRTFDRPIHAGNAVATVHAAGEPLFLTLRPHAFAAAGRRDAADAPAAIRAFPIVRERGLSRFDAFTPSPGERPELAAARVVVAGGRGLEGGSGPGGETGMALLTALADRLGAAVGASRGAVDAGLAPNDWQIGQTGKVVAPDLYVGVGISGAMQHLAGIKDARTIVAINQDPGAPLLAVADLALTADLFTALPLLRAALDATERG